jgi:iron-sulfur cluster assembly protein
MEADRMTRTDSGRADVRRKNVITLTAAAAKKVREIQQESGGKYLRVAVRGPLADGSFKRSLDLVNEPDPAADYLGESQGIQILVDQMSELFLDGWTIDWHVEEGNTGFAFSAPEKGK